MDSHSFNIGWAAIAAVGLYLLYVVAVVFYRLFLSPIRKFPGPKLAALTRLYEGYYDLYKDGQWAFHIQDLHKQYGPIIRISPFEIHIQDPEFYDELYLQKLDKYDWFVTGFDNSSSFATVSSDLHRLRRGAMNPFFSKGSISSRFAVIQDTVKRLCERLDNVSRTGQIIKPKLPYIALTNDVISLFAFGDAYGTLDEPDFGSYWEEMLKNGVRMPPMMRMFPPLRVMLQMPTWVAIWLNPIIKGGIQTLGSTRVQVKRLLQEHSGDAFSPRDHKPKDTIFDQILTAGLPPQELTVKRLSGESSILIGAGSETTAKALEILNFHLLAQPVVLQKLREELRSASVSFSSTLSELESLPYLTAVMKEGLRCANGITTRSPRVIRDPLKYRDWIIPPNTVVSMTVIDVLTDDTIFPDPDHFIPERWLEPNSKRLDKFLVPFTKGPRNCIGQDLAKAEIYACLAMVFSQFEMELVDTDFERDVKTKRDHFVPRPGRDSKGIRVKVLGRVKGQ